MSVKERLEQMGASAGITPEEMWDDSMSILEFSIRVQEATTPIQVEAVRDTVPAPVAYDSETGLPTDPWRRDTIPAPPRAGDSDLFDQSPDSFFLDADELDL